MAIQLVVSCLGTDDIGTVPEAASLLTAINGAQDEAGRLLGSITIPHTDNAMALYIDLVGLTQRRGRIDLVRDQGRIVGVACWITHSAQHHANTPAGPRPLSGMTPWRPPTGPVRDVAERLGRLDLLNLAFGIPHGSSHLHLACLAAMPGHSSRMIVDLLLHHQNMRADRDGQSVYAETHRESDSEWLRRLGYDDCGLSLGHPEDPRSYARAPKPHRSKPSRPASVPP